MIYVLAYPRFAPRVAEQIDRFRASHEPVRAKLVPPHITLVFGSKDVHLPVISQLAATVSKETRAFSISFESHLVEYDPFEEAHKIFLLCGRGRDQLTSLHEQLYRGAHSADLSAAHPFQPHMTVASYEKQLEAEQVDVAHAINLPISADIQALEIVRFVDGTLTNLKTVPLLG